MSRLNITLSPWQTLRINGSDILFKTRASITVTNRANFLFGSQIMPESQATTPMQRLYYAIQEVYVGPTDAKSEWLEATRLLVEEMGSTEKEPVLGTLQTVCRLIDDEEYFTALMTIRGFLRVTLPPEEKSS